MPVVAGMVVVLGAAGGGEESTPSFEPNVVSAQGDRPAQATVDELPCTAPREAANFGLYSLGASYQGLPLTTIIRRCDFPSPQGRANYVRTSMATANRDRCTEHECVPKGCPAPRAIAQRILVRVLPAALLVPISALAMGCGENNNEFTGEEGEVAAVIDRFHEAVEDRDTRTICTDLLAPGSFPDQADRQRLRTRIPSPT